MPGPDEESPFSSVVSLAAPLAQSGPWPVWVAHGELRQHHLGEILDADGMVVLQLKQMLGLCAQAWRLTVSGRSPWPTSSCTSVYPSGIPHNAFTIILYCACCEIGPTTPDPPLRRSAASAATRDRGLSCWRGRVEELCHGYDRQQFCYESASPPEGGASPPQKLIK